ncbi:MAG: hypothetical protein OEZ68_07695 [Gammaproteobacteria bacterium]|nr:hypothetical protein [Gammaproteobacteria bacterium]MDH5800668.1 hypothetical protein [Gammaproteobacteria bacterium]
MNDVYKTPDAELMTDTENNSGMGGAIECPPGVKGWSWGAFLLNWIWAIGNKTWVGLLAFLPYIGFVVAIVLGIKGREWAWKNKRWDSLEHFNRVQKKWSVWALVLTGIMIVGMVLAIAIPVMSQSGTL